MAATSVYQGATNGDFGELVAFARIADTAGRWLAMVYGESLTEQYFWVSATHVNDTLARYASRPLSYGLRLSYNFD